MLSVNVLLLVCLGYVAILFLIAFLVDRRTRNGSVGWLQSPVIYTLSISVYCTSWTFYGAVGSAARNGLEFLTIYLGPTLVFIGWWFLLRKLIRIGRANRITSIADLISSRYGKSSGLAVVITLMAVIAITPYIALQLQSVTRSYQVIAGEIDPFMTGMWIGIGMAVFTILFGTRNLDANERHHGVVAAIALEAIVKLVALVLVGVLVTFGISGGVTEVFANVNIEDLTGAGGFDGPRWAVLIFLSGTAILCLPRQFQVTVVENIDENHVVTASWLFPLYLFGMCIFVLPIALVGTKVMPEGANPDLFVLTLPLTFGHEEVALLAFLGGFSSATSMVIVAAIAVSTMVSNHIVMPLVLRVVTGGTAVSGDVRSLLLISRRISIGLIVSLGFLYFWISGGSDALAAIGLIAFVGVAQFLPALLGAVFWRGATRKGAISGLIVGFVFWVYTLFLPSFGGEFILTPEILKDGLFGLSMLRPQGLFGATGMDPLVHAVMWSVGSNLLVFLVVSGLTTPGTLERLQAVQFIDIYRTGGGAQTSYGSGEAEAEDLFILAQRILGAVPARQLFDEMALEQGIRTGLPHPTDNVIARLERELSGSIGAASAHAMVTRVVGNQSISISDLIDIADETQQLMETTRQLADKSAEHERTVQELRNVNDKLRTLDAQKDDFLSQVSHELRTPMTSIRSFSEILMDEGGIADKDRSRFVTIIHEESCRLTRLLDELLDIGRLEAGSMNLKLEEINVRDTLHAAENAVLGVAQNAHVGMTIHPGPEGLVLQAHPDRLRQVLINVLSNAVKYNSSLMPKVTLKTKVYADSVCFDVIDNGGGVSKEEADLIFEKFARGSKSGRGHGAGLGLPISRAIMRAMHGDLTCEFAPDGTSFFRIRLPYRK
ncbi:MAG: ATP-binding protein [Magnetospiraceae bacterium]